MNTYIENPVIIITYMAVSGLERNESAEFMIIDVHESFMISSALVW
jgi:hypothetical protein